ncbi:MAG: flippase [Patescibacteria group bacterium]
MFKSETANKIAKNTVYQIVGKVISMCITMLAVVIITRSYGREGYGAFSLMQSWPALFFIIVDFGINAIAARELSRDWSKANRYLGNILIIRLLFSILLIAIMSFGVHFFPYSDGLKLGIRLGLFILLTQALYTTTNIFFQVKLRYDFSTIAYTFGYLVILALVLLFSHLKVDVTWVNFSYVIGGLITFILSLLLVGRLGVKPDFTFDPTLWRYLLISALPLGIMFCFSQVSFKQDTLMMSAMKVPDKYGLNNTESVAIYALAYKIFEVFLVIPTFFMNAAYPILVRHMTEGQDRLKKTFSNILIVLLSSGLIVGLLGILFAPFATKILGGEAFSQSVLVLRILSLGLFIFYLTQPLSWLIVILDKQGKLPLIYFASAVFNFVTNLIYIPKYSFYATATTTILTEFFILVFLSLTAYKFWKEKYA